MEPVFATFFEMISDQDLGGHLLVSLLFYAASQPLFCLLRGRDVRATFGDGALVAMLGWVLCYVLSVIFGLFYLMVFGKNGSVTQGQHDFLTGVLWLRAALPAVYAAHSSTKE